jgi:hypothetical protein
MVHYDNFEFRIADFEMEKLTQMRIAKWRTELFNLELRNGGTRRQAKWEEVTISNLEIRNEKGVMSNSEYQELIEFLGRKFEEIDQRFDAVDRRFEWVGQRFDAVDAKLAEPDERFQDVLGHFDHLYRRLERLAKDGP